MTTENNKLIAEFMKLVYKYDGMYHNIQLFNEDGTPKRSGRLIKSEWILWNPHKDWNDLMQVVEKILNLKDTYAQERQKVFNSINPNIQITYNACIEFIKWYNLQIK